MFFIIKEVKINILDFSQRTVNVVYQFYLVLKGKSQVIQYPAGQVKVHGQICNWHKSKIIIRHNRYWES